MYHSVFCIFLLNCNNYVCVEEVGVEPRTAKGLNACMCVCGVFLLLLLLFGCECAEKTEGIVERLGHLLIFRLIFVASLKLSRCLFFACTL